MAKKKKEEVAVVEEQSLATANSGTVVPSFDLNSTELPDLYAQGQVLPVDLESVYWSPKEEGESIRGFINPVTEFDYPDRNNPEVMVKVPTMLIIAQNERGDHILMRNSTKRLVSAIERNFEQGKIETGMPVVITFLGKKKNSTNSNESNHWSIKPILVQQ